MPGFWDRFGQAAVPAMERSGAQFLQNMQERQRQKREEEQRKQAAMLQMFLGAKSGDEARQFGSGLGGLMPAEAIEQRAQTLEVPQVAQLLLGNAPIGDDVQYDPKVIEQATALANTEVQEKDLKEQQQRQQEEQRRLDNLFKVAELYEPWERRAFLRASGMNLPGAETEVEEIVPIIEGETVYKDETGKMRWMVGDQKDEPVFADQLSENQVGRANTIRKDFEGLSKDYYQIRDAYNRVEAAAQNPSAAGDLALIFNYMKILDPGSVVREGEFATAQNAAGVPDQLRNVWNRMLMGTRLGPGQRHDFVNRAKMLFESQNALHGQRRTKYQKIADLYQVPYDAAGLGEEEATPLDWKEESKKYKVTTMDPDQLKELYDLEAKAAAGGWNLEGEEYTRYNELQEIYNRSWTNASR